MEVLPDTGQRRRDRESDLPQVRFGSPCPVKVPVAPVVWRHTGLCSAYVSCDYHRQGQAGGQRPWNRRGNSGGHGYPPRPRHRHYDSITPR
ncbi:hypothetical protein GCM10009610_69520 [Pseudonocardia xinjiangensis]